MSNVEGGVSKDVECLEPEVTTAFPHGPLTTDH